MIRQIRPRTKADRFENDVRASKPRWSRYLYLACVFAFLGYIANMIVGPMLWLQAEGLVTADRVVISLPYEAQILDVGIKPGQVVRKGQFLGQVHSPQVASVIANLASQSAATIARQAELSIKIEIANEVMKTADERLAEAETSLKKMAGARSVVTDASYRQAVREHYDAVEQIAVRNAERRSSLAQLEKLGKAQNEAAAAMEDIRSRYQNGTISAPADGVISDTLARQGDVIRPGEPLAEMFTGGKFVLAYLDTGTLYSVSPGERVTVKSGFASSPGTIVEILPLTVQLPDEFQKTFQPTARGQVVRIALDNQTVFPLLTKITVTGEKLIPGNDTITTTRITSMVSRMASALASVFGQGQATADEMKLTQKTDTQ